MIENSNEQAQRDLVAERLRAQPPKPPLRYAGGKTWLRAMLVPEIEAKKPERYLEPFVGAGAILLAVANKLPEARLIASDMCNPLINLWITIRDRPADLAAVVQRLFNQHGNNKHGYYVVRGAFNTTPCAGLQAAARMLYLNAICFNGLWRENAQGKFNVPFGDVSRPQIPTVDDLTRLSTVIKHATFQCWDFRQALDRAVAGDAIYVDPPYDEGFVAYTAEGFDKEDQIELADRLRAADETGAYVWASNADTPFIREIYAWARIDVVDESRAIAANAERRKPTRCVLIRGSHV